MAKKFTVQSLIDQGQNVRGLKVRGCGACGTVSGVNKAGSVFLVYNPTAYDPRHLYLVPRKVLK